MTPHACHLGAPGAALLMALALLVAGCAQRTPESHASAVERAACAQHADTVYGMRNPDEVFRADTYDTSTRDAPFAGAGLSSVPSEGLSDRYQRAQLVTDCLNGGNGTVGAAPAAPMPEETPSSPPAQP
jgi:hypothetical protein